MSPEQSHSKIGKSVGEKLRAARVAQHYTQSQLAAPDFSVSYISAIERGQIHPSLRALEILAGRLGLSSTQLLPNRSPSENRFSSLSGAPEREDDEVDLILLEAHILIMQGMASHAVNQLTKLSTKRLKRSQQLQHRYLLGWAYFQATQFPESEYTLSEAVQLAKDLNDQYMSLHILSLLARAHAAMRNYTQALLSHQRCLNLLETVEPQDLFFTAQVYMHMGQHYTHLENLDQALEMFNKALSIIARLSTPQDIQLTYWAICQHYASTKNYDLATLYAYKSLHLSQQEATKFLRSELHHYLGHAMMKKGQQEARDYLDEALKQETLVQDQLTQASLLTRNAEWYFLHQAFEEAEQHARYAHELAQPFGDTIIGAEALIVLGHIGYAQTHDEQGDQYFVAGLDMLERLRTHEELANESVRYAQLLEEHGKAHEAFTYFRRAFQSQQKLG